MSQKNPYDVESGSDVQMEDKKRRPNAVEIVTGDTVLDDEGRGSGCCACSRNVSNIAYGVIAMLCAALALILKYAFASSFKNWYSFSVCFENSDICYGNQAVYRVSFSCALFFLTMIIATLIHRYYHFTCWPTKIITLIICIVITFAIPGAFFVVYREISRWISVLFIIIQVLIIVNMVHSISENLQRHIHGEDPVIARRARILYICIALGCLGAAIIGIVMLYVFYNDCRLHTAIITVTVILAVITTIISLTNVVNKGLLTPSLIAAYTLFMTYQALASNPDTMCNPRTEVPLWMIILSVIINMIAVGWNSWRTADSTEELFKGEAPQEEKTNEDDEHLYGGTTAMQSTEPKTAAVRPKYWLFHFIMFLSGCYVAMMLTGWGSESTVRMDNPEASIQSFWIKAASVWAIYLLYFWTLLAPLVCKDREFD